MRRFSMTIAGLTLLAGAIAGGAVSATSNGLTRADAVIQSHAQVMKVDAVHSGVLFKAKHLGVSWVPGRFNEFEGTFTFDENDLSANSIDMSVKAGSVDTNSGGRDRHLKGPDFFDAENHPTIRFKSTKWAKGSGANHYDVTGELTLLGKTRTITVDIEHVGTTTAPRFGTRTGLLAEFSIKRSEFGMNYGLDGAIDDEVKLTAALEGTVESQ